MNPFCTDIDLLHWEPNICRDASFAAQTLMTGTANLAGTGVTISSGSFTDSHIEPGQVLVFSGTVAGSFPIFSVNSATTLTISVLYDKLFDETPEASPVATATGLTFVIRTFWPQRQVVSEILQQAAGLIPGDPRSANATILNPQSLKRPCVLGTLQLIYSALSAVSGAPAEYATRTALYERLYQRALRSALVEIDLNNDGRADTCRQLNAFDLVRA
jgi:hypothetical protein